MRRKVNVLCYRVCTYSISNIDSSISLHSRVLSLYSRKAFSFLRTSNALGTTGTCSSNTQNVRLSFPPSLVSSSIISSSYHALAFYLFFLICRHRSAREGGKGGGGPPTRKRTITDHPPHPHSHPSTAHTQRMHPTMQIVDKKLEKNNGEEIPFKDDIEVELNAVGFKVSNREKPIINNISLQINSKSRILIKGESGSGKSTLLQLISGVIQPTEGNIYINNLSINSINLNHYRSQLGLSLTEETPFEGSIRENLTFNNSNIKDEDIYHALEKVGLIEFIKEQPEGLQTILYPDGKQMSHTISKKIVLARAILKTPKILILEDALDRFNQTETNAIINYLTHKDRPWALIVVSSNNSWTNKCNEIITLDKGFVKTKNT